MPKHRHSILIINPARADRANISHRHARSAVLDGSAVWVQVGVSVRLVAVSANVHGPVRLGPRLPAPIWVKCWRTAEAAVVQPYSPYQRGVAL